MSLHTSLPNLAPGTHLSAKLAMVSPCYNEAHRINTMAFLGAIDQYAALHLIFVNDGSRHQQHAHARQRNPVFLIPQNSTRNLTYVPAYLPPEPSPWHTP